MPNRDGHIISYDVIRGIQFQTIPLDLMIISRPQEDFIYQGEIRKGWKSIETCRNLLRLEALKTDEEFFLLINNDVVMSDPNDVMAMVKFLKDDCNNEYGAVAIDTINLENHFLMEMSKTHVSLALMVIRRFVLENIRFNNTNGNCDCANLMSDMKNLPQYNKSLYIPGRKAKECSR